MKTFFLIVMIALFTEISVGASLEVANLPSNIFIRLTDSSGVEIWSRTFEGRGHLDDIHTVQTNDGSLVIAGTVDSNLSYTWRCPWMLKVNPQGDGLWHRLLPPPDSTYSNLKYFAIMPDGGFLLAGCVNVKPQIAHKNRIWVIKTDSNGVRTSERILEWDNQEAIWINALLPTADDGFIAAGFAAINHYIRYPRPGVEVMNTNACLIKLTASGQAEWRQYYGGEDSDDARVVKVCKDSGYLLLGYQNKQRVELRHNDLAIDSGWAWIIKTNSIGEKLWERTFSEREGSKLNTAFETVSGGFCLAGNSGIYQDWKPWIVMADVNGKPISEDFIGTASEHGAIVSLSSGIDGQYLIWGSISNRVKFSSSELIIDLTSSGTVESKRTISFSPKLNLRISAIEQLPNRNLFFIGTTLQ